jgi:hypothetical protein
VTVNSSFTKELELSAAMTEELYITNARALISPPIFFLYMFISFKSLEVIRVL